MATAAGAFEALRESGEGHVKRLTGVVSKLDAADDADVIKQLNGDATRFMRDADGAVRKMEAEAKAAGPGARREMMEKIATLKASLQAARASLQRSNDGKARAALLKPSDKSKAIDNEAHDKLESAAEKSSLCVPRGLQRVRALPLRPRPAVTPPRPITPRRSTQRLQAAQQVLSETSDIGVGVMDTMTQQREVLLRATAKASNTTTLTGRARSIMRLMQARAITNKALLLLTVFILMAVIGVVVWYGYLRK